MEPQVVLLIVVVAILVIIGIAYGYLQQKRRREALGKLAARLGGEFRPSYDYSLEERYPQFHLFRQGSSRCAYNRVLASATIGGQPWALEAGDYHYQTTSGSGKDRKTHTHLFSFMILQLPYLRTCQISVRREGLFDRLASFMGFDDIDFESADFSAQFHVKGPDKKFAYDLIDPRMMEFLLASDPPRFEIDGRACCLADGKRCWKPEEFKANIVWAQQFFERWPRHLVDSLQTPNATLNE